MEVSRPEWDTATGKAADLPLLLKQLMDARAVLL